jgi:hypothetical protein
MRDSKVLLVSIHNGLKDEYGAPMPIEHLADAKLEFSRFLIRSDIAPFRDSFTLCVYGDFDLASGILTRYDEYRLIDSLDEEVLDFIKKLEAFEASKKRGAAVGGVNPPQVAERPEGQFDC